MAHSATDTRLQTAFATFRVGSPGFCTYVSPHCGFEISRSEIQRIASVSITPEQFEETWANEEFWQDCHNDCEVE